MADYCSSSRCSLAFGSRASSCVCEAFADSTPTPITISSLSTRACHMVERAGYSIESICVPMKAGSLLRGITPRAYIEARPDAIADSIATNAEQRNRADAG